MNSGFIFLFSKKEIKILFVQNKLNGIFDCLILNRIEIIATINLLQRTFPAILVCTIGHLLVVGLSLSN